MTPEKWFGIHKMDTIFVYLNKQYARSVKPYAHSLFEMPVLSF